MAYSSSPSTFLFPPNQHFDFNDTYDPSTGGWLFENPFTPGQPVARANTTYSGSLMLGQVKGGGTINMTELGSGFTGSDAGGGGGGVYNGSLGGDGDVDMEGNYSIHTPSTVQSHRMEYPSYNSIGEYTPSTNLSSRPLPPGSIDPALVAPQSWDSRGAMSLTIPDEQGLMSITLADGTPVNPGFPATSLYTGARYSQLLQAKLSGPPSLSNTPSLQTIPDDNRSRTSSMTVSSNVQAGFAMGPYGIPANGSRSSSSWLNSPLTPSLPPSSTPHSSSQALEPTLGSTLLTNEPLASYSDLTPISTSTSPLPTSASARLLHHKLQQQQQQQHQAASLYRSVSPVPPPSYQSTPQPQVAQGAVSAQSFAPYRPDGSTGSNYPLSAPNYLAIPQGTPSQPNQSQPKPSSWSEMPRMPAMPTPLHREWDRASNSQNTQSLQWPFQRSLPPPVPLNYVPSTGLQTLYGPMIPYPTQNPYPPPYNPQLSFPAASPPKHQHSWNTVPPSHLGSAALSAIETSESSSGHTETRALSDSPPDISHPPSPPVLPRASSGPTVKTQELSPPRKRRRTQPSQGTSGKMSNMAQDWQGEMFDRQKAAKLEKVTPESETKLGPGKKKLEYDDDGEPKVMIACHNCRAKKLKCDGARPRCHHCTRRDHGDCSYDVVLKRRGPGRKRRDKMEAGQSSQAAKNETKQEKARPGIGVGGGRVKPGGEGLGCRFGVSTERG